MDEPTNHLDFDTVQALAEALTKFSGTLVVVSHDRSFINKVANKIIEIRDGFVEIYPGTYEDYLWSLEKGALKERFAVNAEIRKSETKVVETKEIRFNYKESQKKISAEIKELQRKIVKTEGLLNSLNIKVGEINNQLLQAQGPQARQISIDAAYLSREVAAAEEILMTHMESLEAKEKEMKLLESQ